MFKLTLVLLLTSFGLSGCLTTHTKYGLARHNFSSPSSILSSTASIDTRAHKLCDQSMIYPYHQDLTTPPEHKKGTKIFGEFPEYQAEDDSF